MKKGGYAMEETEQRMGDAVQIETRMENNVEQSYLTGTVLRFDDVGDIGGMFKEKIMPGAFEYDKLRINVMHERSKLLGRYPGNATVTEDEKEIKVSIPVLDTQEHRDAMSNVVAGILRGWSVEFAVKPGGARFSGGLREIRSAKLLGIALVDHPVYTASTVAVRDAMAAAEAADQQAREAVRKRWVM